VCARITRFYIALITIIKESAAPGTEPCGVAGCGAHIPGGTSRRSNPIKKMGGKIFGTGKIEREREREREKIKRRVRKN
jgi:hypothetical protein